MRAAAWRTAAAAAAAGGRSCIFCVRKGMCESYVKLGHPSSLVVLHIPSIWVLVAPPEGEMPKIKGPFWVVLVFVYSKGAVVRT